MEDTVEAATRALASGNYGEAITLYTTAIASSPRNADLYIARSTAYLRAKQLDNSLVDADNAVALAHAQGNKDKLGLAQLRRSISLHQLGGRPADALFCFMQAVNAGCTDKAMGLWEARIKKAAEGVSFGEATVAEVPELKSSPISQPIASTHEQSTTKQTTSELPPLPIPKGPKKPTFEWYQSSDRVTLSFLVKGVDKTTCDVQIRERSVSVSFALPAPSTGGEYVHEIEHLAGAIDVAKSSWRALSTKVEVVLVKKVVGHKWSSLEASDDSNAPSTTRVAHTSASNTAPLYPTSSRKGPKNWDLLANELDSSSSTSSSHAASSGRPGSGADAGGESSGGDVNSLFQQIYKDADDDTRRAMIKSFTESNGTSLSTDWKSVGSKRTETLPPEGMEARRY
ncbi:Cochaperone protein [Savitreella phatthalungensis]